MRGRRLFLVAFLGLGSCVSMPTAEENAATCSGWGAAAGTSAFAECMTALTADQAAKTEAANRRFFQVVGGLAAAGASQRSYAPAASARPITTTCFKRGEADAGMNKICYYDCVGSGHAVTQDRVSLCPLTVDR